MDNLYPWETAPSAYDEEKLERTDGYEPWEIAQTPAEAALAEKRNQAPKRTLSEEAFRQTKLGARYFLETPALTAAGLGDMLGSAVSHGAEALGLPYRHTPVAPRVHEGFSRMGFPEPENAPERYVERASRGVVGAGMGIGAGQAMAAGQGVPAAVGTVLAEAPTMQMASAATGGLGGQAVEEAGGPPWAQFGAEIATGMAPPVATIAAKGGADVLGATANTMTRRGQGRIVGDVMRNQATDPTAASANMASSQPVLTPQTAAEASRDAGLLGLERLVRATDASVPFAGRDSARNLQRQQILDTLAGEDIAVTTARRDAAGNVARDAWTAQADAQQLRAPGWAVSQKIDEILARPDMRQEAVEQALGHFKGRIEELVDPSGSMHPSTLYALRKDINAAMEGRLGADKQQFKLASKALIEVKNEIDGIMEDMVPGWKDYLDDYATMSRDIEQRGIVQRIQREKVLTSSVDPNTGRDILSLSGLKRAVMREIEAGNLTNDQLRVMTTIVDDMDSGAMFQAANIRPPGSDTARNITMAHILGRTLPQSVGAHPVTQTLVRPLTWILKMSEEQVQVLLADAMLDPQVARILLDEANIRNARRLSLALRLKAKERGMAIGAVTGAAAEDSPDE